MMKIKEKITGMKEFLDLFFLALLLSILAHYAYNLILIFLHREVVIYEPNEIILLVEMILVVMAIAYVTYRIIKVW